MKAGSRTDKIVDGDLPVSPEIVLNVMPFKLGGGIHGQLIPKVAQPMVKCVKHDPPFIRNITFWFLALYTLALNLMETVWSIFALRAIIIIFFDKRGHIRVFIASLLGKPCDCQIVVATS